MSISQIVDFSTICIKSSKIRRIDNVHNAGLCMDTRGHLNPRGLWSNPHRSNAKDPGPIGDEPEPVKRFEVRGKTRRRHFCTLGCTQGGPETPDFGHPQATMQVPKWNANAIGYQWELDIGLIYKIHEVWVQLTSFAMNYGSSRTGYQIVEESTI